MRRQTKYADSVDDAFWPESILSIRDDGGDEEEDEKVEWAFAPAAGSKGLYGKLRVEYPADKSVQVGKKTYPWRRAFSQVDCQHRLGHLDASHKPVTFCIIPGINRHRGGENLLDDQRDAEGDKHVTR